MWYNVRVVEQFSGKCRELSGSYPSKCSVIGLDNSRQLISINKMQTKTVATQSLTISVRQFSVFYPFFFFLRVYDGFFRYIFFCFDRRL